MTTIKLGADGTLKVPEETYRRLRMEPGDPFSISVEEGTLTISSLIEIYTPERQAEFLLNNSLSPEEYRRNSREVLNLGVDPLGINPAYLDPGEDWQRAESHSDFLESRRMSS